MGRPAPAQHLSDDAAVTCLPDLVTAGWSADRVRNQVAAGRWQRVGRAVVQHNARLSVPERRRAVLINAGPRSALTAFTALAEWGLTGWERADTDLLVPRGSRAVEVDRLPVRMHYAGRWPAADIHALRRLHRPAPAALRAAATFAAPRSACGILAAVVQQGLAPPSGLIAALDAAPRVRHRAVLLAATHDIAQGAQALTEIDFARLCRAGQLPAPARQGVRREPSGRRRYVDAEWRLPDGRRVVAEVDGALHLAARRWWDDQLRRRQNELVLSGDLVLRYPSVVVRCEPQVVLAQLARALGHR